MIMLCSLDSRWRRLRRAAHEGLNKGIVKQYHQTHVTEAILLTSNLINAPQHWNKHFHRNSASTIMGILYDSKTIVHDNDPSVKAINDCVTRLTQAALPGSHWVEFFPWMMHIPSRFVSPIDICALKLYFLDLLNGNVMRKCGMRGIQLCSRVCLMTSINVS